MTNPLTALPAGVRRWLYVAYAVVGPVLIYTESRAWTGSAEYGLWVGVGTALGLVAASNTTTPTAVLDDDSPTGEVAGEASDLPTGTPVETIPGTTLDAPYDAADPDYRDAP